MFGTGINLSILLQLKYLRCTLFSQIQAYCKEGETPREPPEYSVFEVSNCFPVTFYFLKNLSNRDFHVKLPTMFPSVLDYSNQVGP